AHLGNGEPLAAHALGTLGEGSFDGIPNLWMQPFFRPQVRRVLRRCGFIDPRSLDHYLATDGYKGLEKALSMAPEAIISEVERAGLRGRGGAGFPTFRKWRFCREAPSEQKYLICNADEGDPGAFMNRSVLESDPHAVLEGMIIAGRAIGASTGYVYCRAEYPLALERLRASIADAESMGILGNDVLGSGFSFHIEVKEGAGAFVCGEETALIASIEGHRGMPRTRPPFPAISGLWGKPTIINNVESLASVSLILQNGAAWYAEVGSEKSKGTKTFALVGKVRHTGLVEAPMGITLREMIYDIGGGILDDKPLKAVQTGGPSGGCIPASLIDTPVDYDSLNALGTIMGSGGLVVMDEDTCAVDFARYFLDFARQESCGECVPCRLGTTQLMQILEDITRGRGTPSDIDLLVEMGEAVKKGSLCGLGQTAPNPVLTAIRYFREEFEDHVLRNRCPAAVCKEIISAPCMHACPIDTQAATYISLIAEGRLAEAFDVILADNPLPSVCARVCHHPCEDKCTAGKWGKPIAIRALKRFATDAAKAAGIYPDKKREPRRGEKVAIVGSGPAGLMAGYQLARSGHDVTIFESLPVVGGALAVYIPAYRLPREQLADDIRHIQNAGVQIETGVTIGVDISFAQLRERYRAIFIATGAHAPSAMRIPNEDAEGVIPAMAFLKDTALGNEISIGKRIAVVGGGNAAIDAARSALRTRGVEQVTILYRRTRKEMPAFEEEIEAALEEGVRIEYLVAPVRVLADSGRLEGVECLRMELGPLDASGRRRPVPIEGSEFIVELDTLMPAIGERADTPFLPDSIEKTRWDTIATCSETFATNLEGVFAGGDVVTGPDTVIEAMAAGKIAASMIDRYLRGDPVRRSYSFVRPSLYLPGVTLTDEEIESADRPKMERIPVSRRIHHDVEDEIGLARDQAVAEARRCLRCDLETEHACEALRRQAGDAP
ncbi:MAG: FAD-dependent oxidoreductase, partial [Myxococcales bacterium]|nr:FAD-dependent oxidoreductase [Myxococcales bacterium]